MCWTFRIRPVWHLFEETCRYEQRTILRFPSSNTQKRHKWNEISIREKCGSKAKHSARVCTNVKHSWWEKVLLRKPSVPLKTCWGFEENLTSAFYWVALSAYTAFSPVRPLASSTLNRSGGENERLFSSSHLLWLSVNLPAFVTLLSSDGFKVSEESRPYARACVLEETCDVSEHHSLY